MGVWLGPIYAEIQVLCAKQKPGASATDKKLFHFIYEIIRCESWFDFLAMCMKMEWSAAIELDKRARYQDNIQQFDKMRLLEDNTCAQGVFFYNMTSFPLVIDHAYENHGYFIEDEDY